MKTLVKTEKAKLPAAIAKVAKTDNTIEELKGYLILRGGENTITAEGNNPDITIASTIPAMVENPFEIAVSAHFLGLVIKSLPSDIVEIEIDDETRKMTVKNGDSCTKLAYTDAASFPKYQDGNATVSFAVPRELIRELFRKTLVATASKDDCRSVLQGILFRISKEALKAVATNGRILSEITIERQLIDDGQFDIIIPYEACRIIGDKNWFADNAPVKVDLFCSKDNQPKKVAFSCGNTRICTKLVCDEYPNYSVVIPKEVDNPIKVNLAVLLEAVKRASIFSYSDYAGYVVLTFETDGNLHVESQQSAIGKYDEIIAVGYCGGKMRVSLPSKLLISILSALDEDVIYFHITSPERPILLTMSIPMLVVICPIRDIANEQ